MKYHKLEMFKLASPYQHIWDQTLLFEYMLYVFTFIIIKDLINKLSNLSRIPQKLWVNEIYAITPIT